jgi:hypothetical protein
MADSPAAQPADKAPDLAVDVEALGAQMSEHFLELVSLWTQQMTALARAGIDPTPLVKAVAQTLRSTADQLDPDSA